MYVTLWRVHFYILTRKQKKNVFDVEKFERETHEDTWKSTSHFLSLHCIVNLWFNRVVCVHSILWIIFMSKLMCQITYIYMEIRRVEIPSEKIPKKYLLHHRSYDYCVFIRFYRNSVAPVRLANKILSIVRFSLQRRTDSGDSTEKSHWKIGCMCMRQTLTA